MVVAYDTTQDIQHKILAVLRREGGALSHSELVLSIHIPYDVVAAVVNQLMEKGKVEVQEGSVAGMPLVRLR